MNTTSEKKMISVIIPVYNEDENIKLAYDALTLVMLDIQDKYDYELLFTDNHSTDNTFEIIRDLSQTDNRIRALRFSRNFGYQRSILTGYKHAKGDMAVQIDCDMQDPPEIIKKFLKHWEMGYDVIYGVRRSRRENWLINSLRKIFYRLIDFLSEEYLPKDAGDFRLIDRKVLNVLKEIRDQQPYLRGAIAAIGFKQIGIPYDRNARIRGKSKFSMGNMINLALDGMLNHSIIPLRIASYTGFFVTVISIVLVIVYFIGKLIYGPLWNSGFATTTILILISIGLNGLFLGIIGEYIGRIYKQVKDSPLTIIEQTINI
jgi:dolichol-phosphate mannosyltransferase